MSIITLIKLIALLITITANKIQNYKYKNAETIKSFFKLKMPKVLIFFIAYGDYAYKTKSDLLYQMRLNKNAKKIDGCNALFTIKLDTSN